VIIGPPPKFYETWDNLSLLVSDPDQLLAPHRI